MLSENIHGCTCMYNVPLSTFSLTLYLVCTIPRMNLAVEKRGRKQDIVGGRGGGGGESHP